MMEQKPIPECEARAEIKVKNSRFIATIAPVFTVEQARAFIDRIKAEFSDASHNVPAYVIGHGASTLTHCNDDGEPSGTAGRPVLAVLNGSGIGDAAVVVTRYFGGTKLGTGGLVRAYSDAVRTVLESVPRAQKVRAVTITAKLPYPLFEQVSILIEQHHGRLLERHFTSDVHVRVQFPSHEFDAFQRSLRELSRGRVEAEIVEVDQELILPL